MYHVRTYAETFKVVKKFKNKKFFEEKENLEFPTDAHFLKKDKKVELKF